MTHRSSYYAERDRRTRAYGIGEDPLDVPVAIAAGDYAASSPAGQILILAAVNMASRVHRRVGLDIPDRELLVPTLVPARSLREAAESLALAIDPYIELSTPGTDVPILAIGQMSGTVHVGTDGCVAQLDRVPVAVTDRTGVLGAGLGACMGAAALLQLAAGVCPPMRRVSLWGFTEGADADPGPSRPIGPIDVGDRVAVIGAGAVGSAVCYWLRYMGVRGIWEVVDSDLVELHNTNRGLGMLADHAGWAAGMPGGQQAHKADAAASLIGALPVHRWYHEWAETMVARPDLLILEANDHGVRETVGRLGLPLMVHAATSELWGAHLFRHGPGDRCVACLFAGTVDSRFTCAEGELPTPTPRTTDGESSDAALPFLSGAAGLLVVAALAQLEDGYLTAPHNHRRLLFDHQAPASWSNTISRCETECRNRPEQAIRTRLNRGSRWANLDASDGRR